MLREALGVSRKRAISILEHLDAVRFTVLDKEAGGLRSCARSAARFGKIPPHLGTDGLRWAPRSSKPLRGVQNVLDVFDSHTFPPYATSAFVLAVLLRAAKALFCFCTSFS